MSLLLISFCNTFPQGFPLAVYDFDARELEWLPVPQLDWPAGGGTGLCETGGQCYALLQHRVPGSPSTLVVYTPDLRVRTAMRLKLVSDGHSLISHENTLLAVSSGTNELIRIVPDEASGTAWEESTWALGSRREDCDHMNSVAPWRGTLSVSLHGPKFKTEQSIDQQDGGIVDVQTGARLSSSLIHPHSLVVAGDAMYCLESGRGRLWRFRDRDGKLEGEPIQEFAGYVRGLAVDGGFLYVASSARRLRSKSTGELRERPHGSTAPTHCLLYRMNLAAGSLEQHDLTPFGREIYDLVTVPANWRRPSKGSAIEAIITRQLAYDVEHQCALNDLQKMVERYEALRSRSEDGSETHTTPG